ncbi:hypothetical protein [Escherichia coli]|nr:hypothetical protein [Escherichia coli]
MSVNFKEWEYLLDGTDPGWVISNMGIDEEPGICSSMKLLVMV